MEIPTDFLVSTIYRLQSIPPSRSVWKIAVPVRTPIVDFTELPLAAPVPEILTFIRTRDGWALKI